MRIEKGGNREKDLPPIKERLASIRDLSKQLGGIDNIPEEKLSEFGYKRVEAGHILPIEKTIFNPLEKKEKPKEAPFEKIAVSLPATESRYRNIHGIAEIENIERKLHNLHRNNNPKRDTVVELFYESRIPSHHPIHEFLQEFSDWLEQDVTENLNHIFLSEIFYENTAAGIIDIRLAKEIPVRGGNFTANFLTDDYTIPSSAAQDLWETLERKKAKIADPDGLSNFINEDVLQPAQENMSETEVAYYRTHKIQTSLDLTKHLFGRFLQTNGMEKVAENVREAQTPEQMKTNLQEAAKTNEVVQNLKQQEQTIRGDMKLADIETKKELAAQLSGIKNAIKKTQKLLNGMVQYFETDKLFTDYVKRSITDVQKKLVNNTKNLDEVHLILDPTPNAELDKDPGKKSGDCTEGKPLPFADPNIPVSNVKVFDGKKHLGNIYLLETETINTPSRIDEDSTKERLIANEPVWHLEAIQIPNQNIKWEEAAPKIIKELSQQAKEKGVKKITINTMESTISNYDYIGKAFLDYAAEQLEPNTSSPFIKIPDNFDTEKYSKFQGAGPAYVLWSDED